MNTLLFLLNALFWGCSFIAIQPIVRTVPPFCAGALRVGSSLVLLSVLYRLWGSPFTVAKKLRLKVWFAGLMLFGVPFSLLFWAEKTVSPGLAGILNGTVPIWAFLLGLVFLPQAEGFTARKTIGLVLGVLGMLSIFWPKLLSSGGSVSDDLLGTFAVVGMALAYGIGIVTNRSLFVKNPKIDLYANLFQQQVAGFIFLVLLSLGFEGLPHPSEWQPVGTVVVATLYLGFISTSIAFMFSYKLIRDWGAVRASAVTYLMPIVAIASDYIVNRTIPAWNEAMGVLFILMGVVTMNWPTQAPKRRRR
jgi:drug/metabolite transporter (DMT)-like permease